LVRSAHLTGVQALVKFGAYRFLLKCYWTIIICVFSFISWFRARL